ncbi:MAG TPA: hypothetical protein PK156_16030 [Polyangium sp.]|nr:hypothetical protein [Polyangium sp.]
MRIARTLATLVFIGTLQSCTCTRSASNLLGKVDSPVEVELIKKNLTAPNLFRTSKEPRLFTNITHVLKIALKQPLELPVLCEPAKVDVSLAKSLDRLSYRCKPGADWNLVWLGAAEQFISDSTAVGIAPPPAPDHWIDANALPKLVDIAPALLTHGSSNPVAMLNEIEGTAGRAALVDTLAKSVRMPPAESANSAIIKDVWLDKRQALAKENVAQLDGALRAAIESPRPGAGALLRALRVLNASDPTLPDVWAARLREVDTDLATQSPTDRVTTNLGWNDRIWQELIHQLLQSRPAIASEIGCKDLGRQQYPSLESVVAVAHGKTPCPTITTMIERMAAEPSCNVNLSCTGFIEKLHLCTPKDLETKIDAFVKAPYDRQPTGLTRDMAILSAARALGVVPKDLSLRLDRSLYTIDMPAAPNCREAPPGTPCKSDELADRPFRAICQTKANMTEGDAWTCTFRIDDKSRRITNVVARKTN